MKVITERVGTGIKKDQSFEFNLEKIRRAVSSYGYERVWARLEEMKKFYWVQHSTFFESCDCLICNLQNQLAYDQLIERSAQSREERLTELIENYDNLKEIRPYASNLQLNGRRYKIGLVG